MVDALTEATTRRPAGPIGRAIYKDAIAMHGKAWELAHERLALAADDTLLDVGCGGGTFLAQALGTVHEAAGIDYSPDMVAVAERNNARAVAEGRLDIRLGAASALPWADDTVDVVTNLAAFNTMDEPGPVLREACRVLKLGGRLLLVTMAKPEHDDLETRFVRWLMRWARLYEDDELTQLLREAGFVDVEVRSPDGELQIGYGVRPAIETEDDPG